MTTQPKSRLAAFQLKASDKIKSALPELRDCKPIGGRFNLDDLQGRNLKLPGVYIGILNSPLTLAANGQVHIQAHCAAYIATEGREEERIAQGMIIAETIMALLGATQHWGVSGVGMVTKAGFEPIMSTDMERRGVCLLAVTWSLQIARLGKDLFADDGHVFTGLFINDEEMDPAKDFDRAVTSDE